MPTNYNGDFTIPSATGGYAQQSISSSTNTSPIVITTAGSHGFATGDSVQVEGHLVNTSANGNWTISVLSANTFSLTGSVGVGVGAATGYAIDYAVNPLWSLPSGGDTRNASSVSSPLEASADVVPWLYQRSGKYRLYGIGHSHGGTPFSGSTLTALNTSTWTSLTGFANLFSSPLVLANGDLLRMRGSMSVTLTSSYQVAVGFGIALSGGAVTHISGSSVEVTDPLLGIGWAITPTCEYAYAGTTDTYTIDLMGLSGSGTPNVAVQGEFFFTLEHYRPNT